ncbi:MAG: glycosyltransferase [Pirellulaceae bacterium]
MRILILVFGTRGDLQLACDLARQLQQRKLSVVVASSPFYASMVRGLGLTFRAIGDGTFEQLTSIFHEITGTTDLRARVKAYGKQWLAPQLAAGRNELRDELAETDYCINNLRQVWRRGRQVIPTTLITYDPVSNPATLLHYTAPLQQSQGSRNGECVQEVVLLNRQLVDPHTRWPAPFRFTGFAAESNRPDDAPKLARAQPFASPDSCPPVVFTLGSMVTRDSHAWQLQVAETCRTIGRHCVIVGGWNAISSDLAGLDHVTTTTEADYAVLFKSCACVIHHGGCGTLTAVLRVGVPSIILPQVPSQQHFGKLLMERKLATACLGPDRDASTGDQLRRGIERAASDPQIRRACDDWRGIVTDDDGIATATQLVVDHAAQFRQP